MSPRKKPKRSLTNGRVSSKFSEAALRAGLHAFGGKSAIDSTYRDQILARDNHKYTASIDLDKHFVEQESNQQRWDYGVGIQTPIGVEMAFWIEPHPASSTRNVTEMIGKLRWLKMKLQLPHFGGLRELRDEAVSRADFPYRWLVTHRGSIRVLPQSKAARQLAKAGLDQPRRTLRLP